MEDNNELTSGANILKKADVFEYSYNDIVYTVETQVDLNGLVSYLVRQGDKKIVSLYPEDDTFSFDIHNNSEANEAFFYWVMEAIRKRHVESGIQTNKLLLTPTEFYRLNFAEDDDDQWTDIDNYVMLTPADEGGYKQYVLDTNDEQVLLGKPLKTVADLQLRYLSMSGHDLKRNNSDRPMTGQ